MQALLLVYTLWHILSLCALSWSLLAPCRSYSMDVLVSLFCFPRAEPPCSKPATAVRAAAAAAAAAYAASCAADTAPTAGTRTTSAAAALNRGTAAAAPVGGRVIAAAVLFAGQRPIVVLLAMLQPM